MIDKIMKWVGLVLLAIGAFGGIIVLALLLYRVGVNVVVDIQRHFYVDAGVGLTVVSGCLVMLGAALYGTAKKS